MWKTLKPGDEEYDQRMRALFNVYRVQAHEASHRVNPNDPDIYATSSGRVLEEGLSEEAGHAILYADLKRHGRQDVIDWANTHRDSEEVKGTYRTYRDTISAVLDRMNVPADQRPGLVTYLKFEVPPAKRIATLADMSKRYNPDAPMNAKEIDSLLSSAKPDKRKSPGDPGVRIMDSPASEGMQDAFIAPTLPTAPGPEGWHRFMPSKFDDDIVRIQNGKDATAYLKEQLGLPGSRLISPPSAEDPTPDWYREVVQATKDALAKFPALKEGPHPLEGVRIGTKGFTGELRQSAWAITGGDPHTSADMHAIDVDQPGAKTYVEINPDGEPYVEEFDVSSFAAPAGSSIYGRMMHELGHAVSQAAGFSFDKTMMPDIIRNDPDLRDDPGALDRVRDYEFHLSDPEMAMMVSAGLDPAAMAQISNYSQANPNEAWAELFTTLNTPHGMDMLDPESVQYLEDVRDRINAVWHNLRPEAKGNLL
jgi:hypothetical protein